MHRRTWVSLFCLMTCSVFLFSGCFNFGGNNTAATPSDARFVPYQVNEYSLSVPKNWDVIDKSQFTSEVPEETDVVFRNNVKNENYTPTIAVVRRTFQTGLPSLEFAKYVFNRQSSGLYDFKVIKKDQVKIKVAGKEEDTYFLIFESRESTDQKLKRYYQTFASKGNYGFIVLGAVSLQEDANTSKLVEDSVKSFTIK